MYPAHLIGKSEGGRGAFLILFFFFLSGEIGIREADQFFRYTDGGMATHRGNLPAGERVLSTDTMDQGTIVGQKDIYLRGKDKRRGG